MILPLMSLAWLSIICLVIIICYSSIVPLSRRPRLPHPPGPPGEFLLGHYRTVPVDGAFKQYAEWGREYSESKPVDATFGGPRDLTRECEQTRTSSTFRPLVPSGSS